MDAKAEFRERCLKTVIPAERSKVSAGFYLCLCAAVLSPEHALYSVQRATRGVCEGISLNDDGGGGGVRGRVSARACCSCHIKTL